MEKACVFVLLFLLYGAEASKLQMPSTATIGDVVKLECNILFGIGVFPTLDYIRWLKDGQEVYRCDPNKLAGMVTNQVEGVNIDIKGSNFHKITLNPVDLKTSGIWTCEAKSSDGYYGLAQMSGTLTILYPKVP
ncbi:uncharacterized protein LOC112905581 isoform X2 [Agrilus planipennis]|uniref:Uncharacterized protein LOC112905581 isoform X1 n=1 Tax=Agrilus planipennis TaxID=224129 RepID=A0A7F5RDJ4_AGRPL|nr:uncharacterized protein LOC112905581 isoform X1 [Agrilus planipennis]XP_025834048.1 uncharacterized protein LOC112905581 isoform X2 [Agrilus planipennis]